MERMNTINALKAESLKQRVSLFLSCRKLKNLDAMSLSDPQIEVHIMDPISKTWCLVGKTEVINNNLNPDFSKFIECDFYFEREQNLKFIVYDIDSSTSKDHIGNVETTIGKLVGAPKQTFLADITLPGQNISRGKLIVRLDNVALSND